MEQQGEIANRAKCRIEAHASMVTVIENTTGRRAPVQQDFKMRVMLLFLRAIFSVQGQ